MDPKSCAAAFGEAVGPVCRRALELGWSASDGAGWLSGLAAVIAGFIFAAIVMLVAPQADCADDDVHYRVRLGESLPVLIGAFVFLLVAALLLVLVASQFHPLRVGTAASIATAVFAAGAVQTFVALAWLFLLSPRTASAYDSVKLVVRFVMFASGLLLHTTVWKGASVTTGVAWTKWGTALSVALLGGPWVVSRLVIGSRSMVERYAGRFQALTTRCSLGFLSLAVVAMTWVLDRGALTPADAFPRWLALGILLAAGLAFALYDMNLPPQCEVLEQRRLVLRAVHEDVPEPVAG